MSQQIPGYNQTGICPYNPTHIIMMERWQTHLVKCGRNYPNIVLKKCPFNTSHLIKESELEKHVERCESRSNFDLYKYKITSGSSDAEKVEAKFTPLAASDENWDDDDHPSYDPQAYVQNANVIRTLNVAKPSEKRAFREAERRRLRSLQEKQ